jgi:phage tail-like protein
MPKSASTQTNPYGRFNFLLEIDGIAAAGFSEVSGLSCEIDVIEYREGNGKTTTLRKIPGLRKYTNITLKRGMTTDTSLWNWFKSVAEGNAQRADGSILLLDLAGQPVLRWNFHNGWPRKWEGPTLNAKASDVAIETLEIAHEGLDLESVE